MQREVLTEPILSTIVLGRIIRRVFNFLRLLELNVRVAVVSEEVFRQIVTVLYKTGIIMPLGNLCV